ncbi:cytochrome ubiquinol oxidase subunit I [Legionella septentrionalis]|uniref:cytochrome ubiquinol oxidase subunit I n=1 Tax=Legionella septentrionalis TaxID=2498109 RepID=UPI000F8C9A9A|nr:cytochrome ubiquinol oxidase subunit I [Legionella septentrionalis]RUR10529.1 cytochrome ubiquinol oxidase subunit I [Legionella septentrionalis]
MTLVELLSRAQFGFSIGFHILFPTLNLGLAAFLVLTEALWLSSRNPLYLSMCKFFGKIFALTFGMGVVSGIVLAYQIGTNFGPFIAQFGNVLGALFAYETLTAFFLEAGFLGVMLFGWQRVPGSIHFTATCFVAVGTTISAFWIMSANSWMQTPTGYSLADGKYLVADWWQIVFNPSFIPRLLHMLMASYTTTCFVLAGISSYFLLKIKYVEMGKKTLSLAMWGALILVPIQILIGDKVGLDIHHHQPLKTAAIEGVWETQRGAPFILLAWPSQSLQKNQYSISIPKMASLINTHDWNGELVGLKSVPKSEQPPVAAVFFSFRVMVGIGLLMLFTALLALLLRRDGRLYFSQRFHQWCIIMSPMGFIAAISGWLTAEIGRQPWVVYNLLRTKQAISAVGEEEVFTSFVLLVLAYGIVFGFYLYYLFKTIRLGPLIMDADEVEHHTFQYMTDQHPIEPRGDKP